MNRMRSMGVLLVLLGLAFFGDSRQASAWCGQCGRGYGYTAYAGYGMSAYPMGACCGVAPVSMSYAACCPNPCATPSYRPCLFGRWRARGAVSFAPVAYAPMAMDCCWGSSMMYGGSPIQKMGGPVQKMGGPVQKYEVQKGPVQKGDAPADESGEMAPHSVLPEAPSSALIVPQSIYRGVSFRR